MFLLDFSRIPPYSLLLLLLLFYFFNLSLSSFFPFVKKRARTTTIIRVSYREKKADHHCHPYKIKDALFCCLLRTRCLFITIFTVFHIWPSSNKTFLIRVLFVTISTTHTHNCGEENFDFSSSSWALSVFLLFLFLPILTETCMYWKMLIGHVIHCCNWLMVNETHMDCFLKKRRRRTFAYPHTNKYKYWYTKVYDWSKMTTTSKMWDLCLF